MIAILLCSLLQLSSAAVLRQPDSMMLGLEDTLGSILYEIPEYEDPQMLEYELSKLEDHPIVSLIHLASKHVHNKNGRILSKEAKANFQLQLDSVITRLQTVQARMERGSSDIPMDDIEKSIQDLKKLEHIVRPNIDQLLTAMHKGLSHSDQFPQGGLLNVRSKHRLPVEVTTSEAVAYEFRPLITEAPGYEKKPLSSKTKVHEIGVIASKTQVHEIEIVATKPPVKEIEVPTTKPPAKEIEVPEKKPPVYETKSHVTEEPVIALPPPSTAAPEDINQEEERRAPYKDEVFKSESIKEKYEMNPYQSRWTWKTASFAK